MAYQQDTEITIGNAELQTKTVYYEAANHREIDQHKVDVFCSHSSSDREWVEEIVKRLEVEHGFECSYDYKDFIGGKPITTNILNCVKMSRKTVLVITPEFLASRWCEYETQIVFREHLFRKKVVAIPVMLKECVIPDFMAHLTYLEVEDPQFWEKFVEILTSDQTEDDAIDERYVTGHEEDKFNGKSVAHLNSNCCYCCPRFDADILYQELTSKGIRVTEDDVKNAAKATTGVVFCCQFCTYVCSQSRITKKACILLIVVLSLLTGTMFVFALIRSIQAVSNFVFWKLFGFLMLYTLAAIIWKLRINRLPFEAEAATNLKLLHHNVIVGLVTSNCCSGKQSVSLLYRNETQLYQ